MITIRLRLPLYPLIVGCLLGLMQTGLFFQLTFTLSSSFGTYLLVTLCWIAGSAFGVMVLTRLLIPLWAFLAVSLAAYGLCSLLLVIFPFDTRLWLIYAGLVVLTGIYPGVFFARMAAFFPARTLFLWENNGFIIGLTAGTLLFMVFGRWILWLMPPLSALCLLLIPLKIEKEDGL